MSLSITKFASLLAASALMGTSVEAVAVQLKDDAAATDAVADTDAVEGAEEPKNTECQIELRRLFTAETIAKPDEPFTKFVEEFCPSLDIRIPNGAKVSACFHTGYFIVKNLYPFILPVDASLTADEKGLAQAENKKQFNIYVDDFCNKYTEFIPQRTSFVKKLMPETDETRFRTACFDQLASNPNINVWFDPIDPLSSITQQEICDLHFKLFTTLRQRERTSLSEFISFSYLASLDLFANAFQQEDFENCVNMDVVESPNEWVTKFVKAHPVFHIWETTEKNEVAASTASVITAKCTDKKETCAGCVHGIAGVYKKFETYLNGRYAQSFKNYSEKMFNELHEASLELDTASTTVTPATAVTPVTAVPAATE